MKRFWESKAAVIGALLGAALLYAVGPVVAPVWAGEEEAVHGGHVVVDSVHEQVHGEAAHGGEGAHGEHHGITHSQLMNFIWHCLNFTILVIVLVKFLKRPISDALRGRKESIRNSFEELKASKDEAERKYAELEKKLSNMDAEADRIMKAFVEQGQAEKERIIAQAKESAERIKAQAELYVQQELARARKELQAEVAEMAVKMAEDLVRKNITEQDHHRLIGEYLERVVTKN